MSTAMQLSRSRSVPLALCPATRIPGACFKPCHKLPRRHLKLATKAATEETTSQVQKATSTPEYIKDSDFSISKISFGSILTPVGVGLLVYGFGAYFQFLPGSDVAAIMLIYGFPMSLLGFALTYAQLPPVPCLTTKEAFELRATQMTDIQKQIREDVTRFRYGDEQHLDEALNKIFKFGRTGGVPRKFTPVLIGLREEVVDGAYSLILEFKSDLEMEKWEVFQPKIQSFFGPGVVAILSKSDKGVDVCLKCDGSGAGRGGGEKKDVLPPLLPGLKPRQQ